MKMRTTRKGKRKTSESNCLKKKKRKKRKKRKETTRNKVDQQGKGGENISDKKGP